MRLTLRTLLAYMDDILDPADHEELGRKIESSEFATDLIHSSRDTVRRLRLSAPDVLDATKGVDANMVAEYLDNTLAPEAVAEYERVCLESDMHLAEVASCHNVLTMVLGEPAEVSEEVRQRLYALAEKLGGKQQLRIEPSHEKPQTAASADAAPAASTEAAEAAPETAPKVAPSVVPAVATEVPDYLREALRARKRAKRLMIAAVLLLCVTGVAGYLAVWGSLHKAEAPAEVAGTDAETLEVDLDIPDMDLSSPDITEPGSTDAAASGAEGGPDSAPLPFVPGDADEAPPAFDPSATTPEATDTQPTAPATTGDPDAAMPTGASESDMTEPATEPGESEPTTNLTGPDTSLPEMTPDDTATTVPEGTDAATDGTLPSEGTESTAEAALPGEQPSDAETAEPPEPAGPLLLGNYPGNSDVLLQYDADSSTWVRTAPRSGINAGERLLTLPKFRTHVVLAGVNAYLSGGTQIVLPEEPIQLGNEPADLTMELVYGRVILNAAMDGSTVVLKVGDQLRELQLEGSASLAVEARRQFIPGSDAEQEPSPIVSTWYLTSGKMHLVDEVDDLEIEAPAVWQMAPGVAESPEAIDELPEWIDREKVSVTERRALATLNDELAPGQPVRIRLLELSDPNQLGRRREVRSLAAQCGVYIGEFEPFVQSLNDEQQKAVWNSHIDTLREAMALSPRLASQVRDAFVALRGEEAADDLMQMVQGYDVEAIRASQAAEEGAMRQLIGWLDNDSLDYRVLALHNLQEITGKTLGGYRPEHNATQRQRAMRIWWDRFDKGELLPK